MHRILIVSDNVFLQRMISFSLGDMNADVRYAEDMDSMEEACRRTEFDLVIILLTAPFMRGRDVIRAVRPIGFKRPALYVISWQQAEQTVLSLIECGVDQYMTFPVSLRRLRSKVSNELSRKI